MAKIIQIVTQMEAGGAQRVALWLAKGLIEKQLDIEVWYLYKKREIDCQDIKTRIIFNRKPRNIFDAVSCIIKLSIALSKCKPKVLISHTHYANIICQIVACLMRIPSRIAVHHNPVKTYPLAAKIIDPLLGKIGIYTHSVAVSKSVFESMLSYSKQYLSSVSIIYNGIPLSDSLTSCNFENIRGKLKIPRTAFVLLNIGRLSQQKNQDFLLEILTLLPDAYLIIIGDGELRQFLKAKAESLDVEKRVHFIGEISYYSIPNYFSTADVFVFPSIYESFGLALVEAMSFGLPVIVSDIPAAHEVVEDAGLILPLDIKTWASSLSILRVDNELRSTYAKKALAQSVKYDLIKMVESYYKIIADAL
jgi:glycosyltransferase involved in cell wall biosynthesis